MPGYTEYVTKMSETAVRFGSMNAWHAASFILDNWLTMCYWVPRFFLDFRCPETVRKQGRISLCVWRGAV
jgi:hypothetical protein